MTPVEALDRLHEVLEEERAAIRSVNASSVEALAMEKLMLMRAFNRDVLREDPELLARFKDMTTELRNNAVVLAHARNCVRDLVHLAAPAPATYAANGYRSTGTTGRLSLKG